MNKKELITSNYLALIVLFVTILLVSNIASTKLFGLRGVTVDGGTILFPIAYVLGDIITEVYGFKAARRAIVLGFFMSLLMVTTLFLVQLLPPAVGWTGQDAYVQILGLLPRVVAGSLVAYMIGEFTNSFIMAKMKVFTRGKYLWSRTIGSTLVAAFVDTVVFSSIAFYGVVPVSTLVSLIATVYIIKVLVEVAITPLTYMVINHLKHIDKLDHYDKSLELRKILGQ